jgi:hypothetical protein
MRAMTPLRVEGWGAHARRFAARHSAGRVAAIFERSLHIEACGDFLCLGDASIGRGPLNAIIASGAWAKLSGAVLLVGSAARIDRRGVRIGRAIIDTTAARLWRPEPLANAASRERVADAVRQLAHLSSGRTPEDGLAHIVLGPATGASPVLARVARPRIDRLRTWLCECRALPACEEAPPVELLGLGPGLTPSGDDVLCGTLVALRAVGWNDAADRLAHAIDRFASAATSPLSRAFLQAAAEGLGAEPLHETIRELLSGRVGTLPGHLQALGRIGHTSGWDALAGAVLVLQASGTIAVQQRGVARSRLSL